MKRRLDEILEECLSAYEDGCRSIEQSLALYPDLANELEPLLLTVVELKASVRHLDPPPAYEDAAKRRFMQTVYARRRGTRKGQSFAWLLASKAFWASASVAAGIILVAVAVADMASGGNEGSALVVRTATPSSSPRGDTFVMDLSPAIKQTRSDLSNLQTAIEEGKPVRPAIAELKTSTSNILSRLETQAPIGNEDKTELVAVMVQQRKVLSSLELQAANPDEVKDALNLTEQIASKLNIPSAGTPDDTSTVSATPAATAEPTASATPTSTPEATPSATPEVSPGSATPEASPFTTPQSAPTPAVMPTARPTPTVASSEPSSTP